MHTNKFKLVVQYKTSGKLSIKEVWVLKQALKIAVGQTCRIDTILKNKLHGSQSATQAVTSLKKFQDEYNIIHTTYMEYSLMYVDKRYTKDLRPRIVQIPEHEYWDIPQRLLYFKCLKKQCLDNLKEIRQNLKSKSSVRKSHRGIAYRLYGPRTIINANNLFIEHSIEAGVHDAPGQILWIQQQLRGHAMYDPKKPQTNEPHVGIELEFVSTLSSDRLNQMFCEAKLDQYLHLKEDGSIILDDSKGFRYAHELCILTTESNYTDIIERVCKILHTPNNAVNKSCGMHVHIDTRNRNHEIVFANLVSVQPILYKMNPKSRQEPINGKFYCKPTKSRKFSSKAKTRNRYDMRSGRYVGINPIAWNEHKTIEVRMHAGTISARKICNWIRLLIIVAAKPEKIKRFPSTFKGFVKKFELPIDLCEYIVERVSKFDPKVNATTNVKQIDEIE